MRASSATALESYPSAASPEEVQRHVSIAARIRSKHARQVAAIGGPAPHTSGALLSLGMHVGLGALAAFACARLLAVRPLLGWALYPWVAFFIGTRFRALGNMLHEACHGILVRGKRHNRVLGHLLAVLDFTALDPYTRDHFTHHLHLGDPEKDLDFLPRRRFGFADATRSFTRTHLLRPVLLFHLPTFVRPVLFHRGDPWMVTAGRMAYVAGLIALAHFGIGWKAFGLFFGVPYVVTYQVLRYWSDAADHAGIIGEQDEFHRSRNHVFAWRPLNLLLFPRADQYHLTHHLFPAVPTSLQGRVHELLLDDPDYAARDHSVSALVR